ncbi:MAG: GGDEF domain-containing protein [Pseudomonadota bacterium]
MLNQETLLLVQISFTLLTTVLLISAVFYTGSPKEQRLWAVGNVVVCLGLAVGSLTSLPPFVHATLSYGVIGLGMGLVLRGLRIFCRRELAWGWIAGISLLALALPGYYTLIQPDLHARLIVTGFYFGALNWICAATLLRHSRGRGIAASLIGFGVLGLSLVVRGGYLLMDGTQSEEVNNEVMNASLFMISVAQVCIVFGLISMVAWRYAERLRLLSTIDTLTGALNRAALDIQGRRILRRASKSQRSAAVVMIDADHFKQINDSFGHPAGDEVLRHLARILNSQMRPNDLMARYGGEEFALVFDGMDLADAMKVSERLCRMIEQETPVIEGHAIRYTISSGVACSDQHGYDLARLISESDAAMYQAKKSGRNQVRAAAASLTALA